MTFVHYCKWKISLWPLFPNSGHWEEQHCVCCATHVSGKLTNTMSADSKDKSIAKEKQHLSHFKNTLHGHSHWTYDHHT